MLVWSVEFSCWLILVRPHVLSCRPSWSLTLVTQSGGRKLTYIMMVAICNLHVEYGHCTVNQKYENVLNNVVQITKDLIVLLAILYIVIRIVEDCGLLDSTHGCTNT
jgi:hypothetical protein